MRAWSAITHCPEQTRQLGRLLGEAAAAGQIVYLRGPLGAGKTCMVQGVAVGLGVPANLPVTSPSYSLLNIHHGRMPLYHLDLYRLPEIDDLDELGYDEFAGLGLTLIEWADRLREDLDACLEIVIRVGEGQVRQLDFLVRNPLGERLIENLAHGWQAPSEAAGSPGGQPENL